MQRLEPVTGDGCTYANWYQAVDVQSDMRLPEWRLYEVLRSFDFGPGWRRTDTRVRGLRLSAATNLRIRSEPADWLCRTDDLGQTMSVEVAGRTCCHCCLLFLNYVDSLAMT